MCRGKYLASNECMFSQNMSTKFGRTSDCVLLEELSSLKSAIASNEGKLVKHRHWRI